MNVQIINLEANNETGNRRIANRFAADRARVESFNRHMVMAGMNFRTALWETTPRKISPDRIYIAAF